MPLPGPLDSDGSHLIPCGLYDRRCSYTIPCRDRPHPTCLMFEDSRKQWSCQGEPP
ncbi:hypothetical protein RAJCM14343_2137 [Rhodococcus aetherivorans]|uniref:Uncharacterized protein n=1 Tax=Rhodococcus aetherivorans TaxID=191292 RepID=A0ABQ0YK11_9NOCA|nr:hypothetical protein RAJCM14343_2137 [Rhodococcus aetherivorans]CCW11263.1 hypothetical protein EBESD8_17990 [Rhodococcus aetherivorans]